MKVVSTAAVATAAMVSNFSHAQAPVFATIPVARAGAVDSAEQSTTTEMSPSAVLLERQFSKQPDFHSASNQMKGGVSMVVHPATPVELVMNIRTIFVQDLLFKDDFYTENNLKKTFNADRISIINSDNVVGGRHIQMIASDFSRAFPDRKIQQGDRPTPTAQLIGGKTVQEDGATAVGLNFGMPVGGPSFNDTKTIFGVEFTKLDVTPSGHQVSPPAKAPHGNESWEYRKTVDGIDKALTISFNGEGELFNIIIRAVKR